MLPLLATLAGPATPDSDRAARVVVVDDASPQPIDAEDLPDGVELLRREANGGFGAAVNTGLAALAQTPAIEHALVLNSDLEIPTGLSVAHCWHMPRRGSRPWSVAA